MSNSLQLLKEFRPALKFLAVFIAIYLVANIIYGIWIEEWKPQPDPLTVVVTRQSVFLINMLGESATLKESNTEPIVSVYRPDHLVLRVYEGCNGINVMIVFIAFMVAFVGDVRRKSIFIMMGLLLIHLINLTRIGLLYYTAAYRPSYFYYFHKYVFTAVLYAVVFILWYIWMNQSGPKATAFASGKK